MGRTDKNDMSKPGAIEEAAQAVEDAPPAPAVGVAGGFDLSDLPEAMAVHKDVKLLSGGFVRLFAITDDIANAVLRQIPDGAATANERHPSTGEVLRADRQRVRERMARQRALRQAVFVVASARGEHGITHERENWTPERDGAWCEAAARRMLEALDSATYSQLVQEAELVSPLTVPQGAIIGDEETPGNS